MCVASCAEALRRRDVQQAVCAPRPTPFLFSKRSARRNRCCPLEAITKSGDMKCTSVTAVETQSSPAADLRFFGVCCKFTPGLQSVPNAVTEARDCSISAENSQSYLDVVWCMLLLLHLCVGANRLYRVSFISEFTSVRHWELSERQGGDRGWRSPPWIQACGSPCGRWVPS